jgi:hypothetical protein
VTTALRHRVSWSKRPLDKRVELAQKGYLPLDQRGWPRVTRGDLPRIAASLPGGASEPCALAKGVNP